MHDLLQYTDRILASKDISPQYAAMVRAHCRHLVAFAGQQFHVEELSPELVNRWLTALKATGLHPLTIDGYRRNVLLIWRAAYEDHITDTPPLRVKTIKKPRPVIEAYTHAELRALLAAAARLRGRHRNGNRRADFWQALIHSAYSTGLRKSDLLLVFRSQVSSDGVARIVQNKTGYSLMVRFSPDALKFAARLHDDNGLLLPWPYRKDAMTPRWNQIVRMASVNRGTLKWLRRSGASYAERQQPGAGPLFLGHQSAEVFRSHYEDRSITAQPPPGPPAL